MTEKDCGQHFTFCCLGHSDLNSHFLKTLILQTHPEYLVSLISQHTLSPMSFKHDSMCHRKICIGQKIITSLGRKFQVFREFQVITVAFSSCSPISVKNPDICNFYSSLTMNNGKLISYFRSHLYDIVSNMTHFLILFGMRKNGLFRTVFHLY